LAGGWNIAKGWISELSGWDLSRPVSVNLLITNECNSRCIHCDVWQMNDPGLLSLDDYTKLAADLAALGVPYVTSPVGSGAQERTSPASCARSPRAGCKSS